MNDLVCVNPECKHVGLKEKAFNFPGNIHMAHNHIAIFCPECLVVCPAGENKAQALTKYNNLKQHLRDYTS